MRRFATKGLASLAVLALGCVFVPSTSADGKDGKKSHDVIKACVEKRGGEARIVPPGRPCRDNETAVFWNVEGPPGDQGPAGPAGATGAAGAAGAPGAPGRDGLDGRDGRDGQDCTGGGTPPPAGPIGELKIEDIHPPGEASPILSVTGGLTVEGASGGGGGGSGGKVSFQDIHVIKVVDKFSPKQLMFGAMGTHIPVVDIDVFRQGTTDVELNYKLQDVLISSIQQSGSSNQAPVESVSMNFGKITITFTPLNGPPVVFCYDVKLNKGC